MVDNPTFPFFYPGHRFAVFHGRITALNQAMGKCWLSPASLCSAQTAGVAGPQACTSGRSEEVLGLVLSSWAKPGKELTSDRPRLSLGHSPSHKASISAYSSRQPRGLRELSFQRSL